MSAAPAASLTLLTTLTGVPAGGVAGAPSALDWSPDGARIAVAGPLDTSVTTFDVAKARRLWTVEKPGPRPSTALGFSPDGQFVVTPSVIAWGWDHPDSTLSLLDARTGAVIRHLTDPLPPKTVGIARAAAFAMTADRRALAIIEATLPNRVLVYDTASWSVLCRLEPGRAGAVRVALNPEQGQLYLGFVDGTVEVWDIAAATRLRIIPTVLSAMAGMVRGMAPETVVVAGDGSILTRRTAPGEGPGSFATAADDPSLLVGAWEMRSGHRIADYRGPGLGVTALAVTRDGAFIAAAKVKGPAGDGLLLVWAAATMNVVAQVTYSSDTPSVVAFDDSGTRLAAGTRRGIEVFAFRTD